MKKILAFAGSNSSKSINYQLINYVGPLVKGHEVTVLDIRKWAIPVYSEDMDEDNFTPNEINELIEMIKQHDAFIISVPEHNEGSPAFFKNITDWLTRRSDKVMEEKPVLLLSTSTGRRGAGHSREYSLRTMPRIGANIVADYGLPSFNYTMVEGKLVAEEQANLDRALGAFLESLK